MLLLLSFVLCALFPAMTRAQEPTFPHFYFEYPSTTTQCEVVSVTWTNGTAPFTFYVVPINGQPFQYPIPDSAYSNGAGRYDISLQLRQGSTYVVFMGDANGVGTGGTSEVQIVQASGSTECLNTAAANQTDNAFSFSVSGVAQQCETGFALAWNGARADGPYNATVIPLDQQWMPYDVTFDQTEYYEANWKLNLTTGSRFTVMMNSGKGYGLGGAGGIYQVAKGADASCVSQTSGQTGSWPAGLATNTLPVASAPASSSGSSGLSGGAIAGVVIGVLAVLLIVALAAFWLLRRKRRRRTEWEDAQHAKATQMDLSEGYLPVAHEGHGGHSRLGSDAGSAPDSTEGYGSLRPMEEAPMVEPFSTGLLTPSMSNPRGSTSASSLSGESREPDGPGSAGPLPSKSRVTPSQHPSGSRPSASHVSTDRGTGLTYPPGAAALGHGEKGESQAMPVVPAAAATSSPAHLRVANPDAGGAVGGRAGGQAPGGRRDRRSHDGPTFRRHEDAGRLEQEVVDLPPLYTDVPQDGPRPDEREQERAGLGLGLGGAETAGRAAAARDAGAGAGGEEDAGPGEGDTVLMSGGPPTGDVRRADGR